MEEMGRQRGFGRAGASQGRNPCHQGAPNTKPCRISTSLPDHSGSNPYERLAIVRELAKGSMRRTLVTSK